MSTGTNLGTGTDEFITSASASASDRPRKKFPSTVISRASHCAYCAFSIWRCTDAASPYWLRRWWQQQSLQRVATGDRMYNVPRARARARPPSRPRPRLTPAAPRPATRAVDASLRRVVPPSAPARRPQRCVRASVRAWAYSTNSDPSVAHKSPTKAPFAHTWSPTKAPPTKSPSDAPMVDPCSPSPCDQGCECFPASDGQSAACSCPSPTKSPTRAPTKAPFAYTWSPTKAPPTKAPTKRN